MINPQVTRNQFEPAGGMMQATNHGSHQASRSGRQKASFMGETVVPDSMRTLGDIPARNAKPERRLCDVNAL